MYSINKGVDRPPEVLGIKGMNYLMLMAGSTLGGLLVVVILIVGGLPGIYAFPCFLFGVFILFNQIVAASRKYGERGFVKVQARLRMPSVITVRSSEAFRGLRPGKTVNQKNP